MIVAMDEERGIGIGNSLPWRLSADLKKFKEVTMGHHIVFGRKTYESIGKPLPGRTTIIITRNADYHAEGCDTVQNVEEALALAQSRGESECCICGGAEIYALAFPFAQRLYLTQVHASVHADTFFPAFNEKEWQEESSEHFHADEKNQYDFSFRVLRRLS